MIELERTFDMNLVAKIMTHPRLWPHLADDFYPAPDNFIPLGGDNIFYLLAREAGRILGLCIAHPINTLLWEVHHALLPSAWGRKAHRIGEAFQQWIWDNTKALKLVGFTPSCNRLAVRYALKQGLTKIGEISQCFQRGGMLCDVFIFEKGRPI